MQRSARSIRKRSMSLVAVLLNAYPFQGMEDFPEFRGQRSEFVHQLGKI